MQTKPTLAPSLQLGPISLAVRDIVPMTAFYQDVIGLHTPLVRLLPQPHLPAPPLTEAGLYHLALLFSTRSALAQAIQRVLSLTPHLFTGSADHLVSEAFYLNDPEGNGIELYFDRDPSTWQWENGQVRMTSMYIDPTKYIDEHAGDQQDSTIVLGHVHLKVGNIEQAASFYGDILGFTLTAKLPGALFVSVGGYHHHLGLNTWESQGAQKRKETRGLIGFEIAVPGEHHLTALKRRFKAAEYPFTDTGKTVNIHDPWHNLLIIRRI